MQVFGSPEFPAVPAQVHCNLPASSTQPETYAFETNVPLAAKESGMMSKADKLRMNVIFI
jgi:hypothetical protein